MTVDSKVNVPTEVSDGMSVSVFVVVETSSTVTTVRVEAEDELVRVVDLTAAEVLRLSESWDVGLTVGASWQGACGFVARMLSKLL